MLRNYFTTALRNLFRHKVFSLINILGLAIGMATCLLIFQYVSFEFNYDQFHPTGDQLQRVYFDTYQAEKFEGRMIHTPYQLGPSFQEEIPEIEAFIRWHPFYGSGIMTYNGPDGQRSQFSEEAINFVDPVFLEVFGFELLAGDASTALASPRNIVITEEIAAKYFGEGEEAIGKTLELTGGWARGGFQVAGVLKTLPTNSHLTFDFLLPMEAVLAGQQYQQDDGWGWFNFETYVLLSPGADTTEVMAKMDQVYYRFEGESMDARDARNYPKLQRVSEVHLHSTPSGEPSPEGRAGTLYFFILIGIFILVIAWVNYINLSTARAMVRAREVGIRKTVGAMRGQLIRQFLLESALVNAIAVLLALVLAWVLLPTLSDLVDKDLSMGTQDGPGFWLALIGVFVVGAFLSGLYPALILSGFQPIAVLKGRVQNLAFGVSLRKVLVVAQFAASAFLIASTIAVYQQVSGMKNQDLGMNLDQVLVVRGPGILDEEKDFDQLLKTFKSEVKQDANIYSVASSAAIPGGGHNWGTRLRKLGSEASDAKNGKIAWVDYDFLETYDMEVISGRAFSEEFSTDEEGLMLNETAVKIFDLGDPQSAIQQQLILGDDTVRVLAVLKDFAWGSLQQEREAFMLAPDLASSGHFSFKLSPEKLPQTLAGIEEHYRALFPGNPFEYHFQDEFFNRQYREDQQFGNLFGMFTILAILVACLGLFGLASFSASMRIKEIGVRKVLGASVGQLLSLLTREYLALVLIGSILGLPFAFWYIQSWLEPYAYQISLGVWFFLGPLFFLSLVAFVAVGYQTLKASRSHPIEALRYE